MREIQYHCKYDRLVDPKSLRDHPQNDRNHPDSQIEALAAYIAVSGFRYPVVVSERSGYIVSGHGRKYAALRGGYLCPVVYQPFETDTDEIAFLVADNKFPELAVDLDDVRCGNLDSLSSADFDLSLIGFDQEVDVDFSSGRPTTANTRQVETVLVVIRIPLADLDHDIEALLEEWRIRPGFEVSVELY